MRTRRANLELAQHLNTCTHHRKSPTTRCDLNSARAVITTTQLQALDHTLKSSSIRTLSRPRLHTSAEIEQDMMRLSFIRAHKLAGHGSYDGELESLFQLAR